MFDSLQVYWIALKLMTIQKEMLVWCYEISKSYYCNISVSCFPVDKHKQHCTPTTVLLFIRYKNILFLWCKKMECYECADEKSVPIITIQPRTIPVTVFCLPVTTRYQKGEISYPFSHLTIYKVADHCYNVQWLSCCYWMYIYSWLTFCQRN